MPWKRCTATGSRCTTLSSPESGPSLRKHDEPKSAEVVCQCARTSQAAARVASARCRSLSVSVGRDGRILVNCFAGCLPYAITAALGFTLRDLMPPGGERADRRIGT